MRLKIHQLLAMLILCACAYTPVAVAISTDLTADGVVDAHDLKALEAGFFSTDPAADINGDGIVSFTDLALLRQAMTGGPQALKAPNPGRGPVPVWLDGPTEVAPGQTFTVTINADFTSAATLGGGFDLSWDFGILSLTNVEVTAPNTNPAFTRPGDEGPGTLTGLAFGSFDGYNSAIEIAVLTFEAQAVGIATIDIGPNFLPAGPLVDLTGMPLPVSYTGLEVTVVENPEISVDPVEVVFPEAKPGVFQEESVVVTNTGFAALTVISVDSGGNVVAPFAVVGEDCTAAPLGVGESCQIDVQFVSLTTGSFSGELSIESDDPMAPVVIVPLSATSSGFTPFAYVADAGSGLVIAFNLDTGTAIPFASLPPDSAPLGLAVDDAGKVYVSLRFGTQDVFHFAPDGTSLGQFAPDVGGVGLMEFSIEGELVGGGRTNSAALFYETTGELINTVPSPDATLRFFTGVMVSGDALIAADALSGEIYRYDLSSPAAPPELYISSADAPVRPHGITIGHNNNLFISGMQEVREYRFDTGEPMGVFADYLQLGLELQPGTGMFAFESADFFYDASFGAYLVTTQVDKLYVLNTTGDLVATFQSLPQTQALGIGVLSPMHMEMQADPAAFPAGQNVSAAYPGLSLSTAEGAVAGAGDVITMPLQLTSDLAEPVFTNGATFEHPGGPIWTAASGNEVFRADFDPPALSVAMEFLPDDTDTGVLQIYDDTDTLLGQTSARNSVPFTLVLGNEVPPISYMLATFVDPGLLGSLDYTAPMITRAIIDVNPPAVQFDAVPLGGSAQTELTITNQGDRTLLIGQLGSQQPLELPFVLTDDNCSNQRLSPAEICMATVQFDPTDGGTLLAQLDIPTNDRDIPRYQVSVTGRADTDSDGISDDADNCLILSNTEQRDTDGDGIGNRCDPDFNNDCIVNFGDLGIMNVNFFVSGDLDTDLNGDNSTNFGDLAILSDFFFSPPGPSGVANLCE